MPRKLRQHVPGAIFHVTQRGNDRRPIFLDDHDRTRYIAILGRALERHGARIHAYCLLTNHVHLLLQADEYPLSSFMHALGMRYARWFNDRWGHCGHLFQGRFFSGIIEGEPQLMLVLRYIHLNPVRAGLAANPGDHRWSSHRAYSGSERPPVFLTTRYLLSLFGHTPAAARVAYTHLVSSDVNLDDLRPEPAARPQNTQERVTLERILDVVTEETGCSRAAILGNARDHRTSMARFAVVHLARELAGYQLVDLARLLGRDSATLCNGVARRMATPTMEWQDLMAGVRHSLSSKKEIGNT